MAVLYDQLGREIRPRTRPDELEIHVAQIRDRWSTYPSHGLTPTRLARILKEADNGDVLRQSELFEEMEEKDAHLYSQFQTRKLSVLGLNWEVIPASEDVAAKKTADFCRDALESMENLEDDILDLLDAIPKGFSLMEILWDVSKREIGVRELRWVHPKRITFWNSMTPRILTDSNPVEGVDPPPWKCIYHRHKARSGYDTRAGVMRVCAWMYLFKNYAVKDWTAFAEVFGVPLRVGKFDQGASDADKTALLDAVASIGSDAAGIISKATEIEFIEAQKTGTLNIYESLTSFCDAQQSKAILGQVLTSDSGGQKAQGSYALGRVHSDVRQDILESDAKAVARTITAHLLRPLIGFNFGWDAPVPRFRFDTDPPEDKQSLAETYRVLVDLGYEISQEHIEERFKIPRMQDGETPLNRKPDKTSDDDPGPEAVDGDEPGPTGTGDEKTTRAKARSMLGPSTHVDAGQDYVDALAAMMIDQSNPLTAQLESVIGLVRNCATYEEILETIVGAYRSSAPDELQEMLTRATFAANLMGYVRSRHEAED